MSFVDAHLPLAAFGPWDWGVVAAYFAAMIGIGVFASRRNQATEEYFLGGRSIPSWALAISIVATTLSAATFVGVPDLSYNGNLTYLTLSLGGFLAVLIVGTLFVPKLYSAGTITIYGYLSRRYGEGARIAVSVMFLLGRMLASGARLFIAAIPLCLLLFAPRGTSAYEAYEPRPWQLVVAICVIGLVGTFYTMHGGIRTVIWIDVIQFFIVAGAALLSIALLLRAIPLPIHGIIKALAEPLPDHHGHGKLQLVNLTADPNDPYTLWAAVLGSTWLSTAVLGVDQDFAQRFLVSKSASKGALSLLWSQLISVATVAGFMAIGLLLYVFYRRPDLMGTHAPKVIAGRQGAYPIFLLNELPPVCSGLAIAGFFAIAQGSMDSAINALASSAVADIYLPLRRMTGRSTAAERSSRAPKLAVALMGVTMVAFASVCVPLYDPHSRTLIDFALGVMAFAFTGMLGVFLTALLTRRGNTVSVLGALAAGVVSVVLMQPGVLPWWTGMMFHHPCKLASTWWMPVGTIISFAVCVAGRPALRDTSLDSGAGERRGFEPVLPSGAQGPAKFTLREVTPTSPE